MKKQWIAHLPTAVLSTLVAASLAYRLHNTSGERATILLYVASVAITAGFGGFWPGALATILSGFSIVMINNPSFPISVGSNARIADLLLFLLTGFIASGVSETLHSTRRKTEVARRDAESARREASPGRL